jgi:UDP-glucose:(heptosyl)LPS alpha-1,3-glucosyltransferase
MKIAFITEHFNPSLGGAETYMSDFGKYLIKNGHEVHFFTQDDVGDYSGLQFHIIKVSGLARKFRWLQWMKFLKLAKQEVEKEQFDITMGTGKSFDVNVFQPHGGTVRASHRQNALLVRNPLHRILKKMVNLISPKHIVALRIEKNQYKNKKTRFIAISEMVRSHMKEFYKLSDKSIDLVYNGIDTSRFSPATSAERKEAREFLELPDNKVIFSIVAHNFKLKGIKELIEAAVLIQEKRQDFLVVVAGAGKQKLFLQLAEKLGVSQYFHFLGAVSDPEKVYTASDVYVQPTWYDPCSLVVLEALAAGLPVITSKFNGAGEFIEQGREGYVISRPDSHKELATAMVNLFDEKVRDKMGAAAREKISGQTLEKNFGQMLEVFERVKKKQ